MIDLRVIDQCAAHGWEGDGMSDVKSIVNKILSKFEKGSTIYTQTVEYIAQAVWDAQAERITQLKSQLAQERAAKQGLIASIELALNWIEPCDCSENTCLGCKLECESATKHLNAALAKAKGGA